MGDRCVGVFLIFSRLKFPAPWGGVIHSYYRRKNKLPFFGLYFLFFNY